MCNDQIMPLVLKDCNKLLHQWILFCRQKKKSHSDDTAVKLLDWLRRLHQSEQLGLNNRKSAQGKTLEQLMFSLECKDVS
jgi:hypothetical protein